MALGTFIAGRYSSTHNSVDLGITRKGYNLSFEIKAELIDETDMYGLSLIDFIQRGASCSIEILCREWKAQPIASAWGALTGTLGELSSTAAPISRLGSDMAKTLVMTSTANTPAAAAPATLTATGAVVSPNFNMDSVFDSRLRELPIRFVLLPYVSTNLKFFSTT